MRELPDLRFIEPGYELMLLDEYLKLLKANVPSIVVNEEERIWSEFDRGDDAESTTGWHLVDRLQSGITSRFLTASVVVASWAVYEGAIQDLADHIAREQGVRLRMSQLRGGLLQRARDYFTDVLKFELHPAGSDWLRLERFAQLRHVLAHTNGRLDEVDKNSRKPFQDWVSSTPGLDVIDARYVVVSLDFASEALRWISYLVDDLVERTRESF